MDDNMTTLNEAQYEWARRLVDILQPMIYEGIHVIYNESVDICRKTDEDEKYLMTFQNFLSRVPKWNEEIVQKEVSRIVEKSRCTYLTDLITCVHITHLKILTSIRTGKSQKKIDITIPRLSLFIHKVYINLSRVLYSNVYLFDRDVQPLALQKNKSEVNKLIKNSILDSIRESIPVEQLLRSYLDESSDLVREEVKLNDAAPMDAVPMDVAPTPAPKQSNYFEESPDISSFITPLEMEKEKEKEKENKEGREKEQEKEEKEEKEKDPVLELLNRPSIKFSDVDYAMSTDNIVETVVAPKDISTLETISAARNLERKALEALEDDEDKLNLGSEIESSDLNIEVLS